MGCGCGKKRKTLTAGSGTYQLTMPNGEKYEKDGRLEAEKLNVDLGGGGKVAKV